MRNGTLHQDTTRLTRGTILATLVLAGLCFYAGRRVGTIYGTPAEIATELTTHLPALPL